MKALPPLGIEDFPETFTAIHGHAPYAWQQRLLSEIAKSGHWPDVIAAPTGSGKTAVLDVALFHLALEAAARPRQAPMRIVLAVDRRIIVDQAFERARQIRDALETAGENTPLARMADRLRMLSGGRPLHIAELRGGMPLETEWARRPEQPTILCTTVDQLGSRLLFRGYGVSSAMAPVHAGLLGCDALLLLDEAHLSRAFEDTLRAIGSRRQAEKSLGLPWEWTALTATPRNKDNTGFRLTADERSEEGIAGRLHAHKEIELIKSENGEKDFVAEARKLCERLIKRGETAPVIAVVVNRVLMARQLSEALRQDEEADVILLTGRVRPIHRDKLVDKWRRRLEGLDRRGERPLFVVATQCIEAGADFDFDAMISQIAPLDALRQRFGRLARSGNRGNEPAPGAILASDTEIKKKEVDPVYGKTLSGTWSWLNELARKEKKKKKKKKKSTVDFGPDALDALIDEHPPGEECTTPALPAPPLRDADLSSFAMTAPRPFPDPAPALFLHGDFRDEAEVSLVWRADAEELLKRAAKGDDDAMAGLRELLALLPPRPAEALKLPIRIARKWLADPDARSGDELADIPAGSSEEKGRNRQNEKERILCWRGRREMAMATPGELRPGDVVVLPAGRGGCDDFGWAPESRKAVTDIADRAAAPYAGRQAVLRLHPAVWSNEYKTSWAGIAALLEAGATADEIARATGLGQWSGATGLILARPYGDDPAAGAVLIAPRGLPDTECRAETPATEGDEGLFSSRPVGLTEHARAVAAMARRQARTLGLKKSLIETLALAGRRHDDGKADPRFQLWLRSIEGLPEQGPPIAKTTARAGQARQRDLRMAASLPERWRHEVASVRCALEHLKRPEAMENDKRIDRDLLLWLIGTHHGHGRPFFPHDDDWDDHTYETTLPDLKLSPAPGPDKLDFDWNGTDWAGLMEKLQERYGYWGIAFLEACLRLADHRVSAGEEAR